MTKITLLSSAPTLAEIENAIQDFYCGERKPLEARENQTWLLTSEATGKTLEGVQVTYKKGRYRFEALD